MFGNPFDDLKVVNKNENLFEYSKRCFKWSYKYKNLFESVDDVVDDRAVLAVVDQLEDSSVLIEENRGMPDQNIKNILVMPDPNFKNNI